MWTGRVAQLALAASTRRSLSSSGRCMLGTGAAASADPAHSFGLARMSGMVSGLSLAVGVSFSCAHSSTLAASKPVAAAAAAAGSTAGEKPVVTLYQYEMCPFCNKVKAFLDYNSIPYETVEVNPITKSQTKFSKYRKVPIAVIGDQQLNDSDLIIDQLSQQLQLPDRSDESVSQWRSWVNNKFIRLLTVNIYRTFPESLQTFDYMSSKGDWQLLTRLTTRYFGATTMYLITKHKLREKYGVKNDREEMYAAANEWANQVQGKLHGGETPDLADLAVFGALRSIDGTQTFQDLMANSQLGPWFQLMQQHVSKSSRIAIR